MQLVLDDVIDSELKENLLSQDGITDVDLIVKDFVTTLNIKYNDKIAPIIIMKYIELFQGYKYSFLLEFDKGTKEKNIGVFSK